MSLSKKNHHDEMPDDEIEQRFEEIAMATPELGGLGPRDWTPAEDVEGFAQPNPPLPKLRPATISGIILLVISLVGLCLVGLLHPEFSAIMAVACLLVLAGSFYLLMFKK